MTQTTNKNSVTLIFQFRRCLRGSSQLNVGHAESQFPKRFGRSLLENDLARPCISFRTIQLVAPQSSFFHQPARKRWAQVCLEIYRLVHDWRLILNRWQVTRAWFTLLSGRFCPDVSVITDEISITIDETERDANNGEKMKLKRKKQTEGEKSS